MKWGRLPTGEKAHLFNPSPDGYKQICRYNTVDKIEPVQTALERCVRCQVYWRNISSKLITNENIT